MVRPTAPSPTPAVATSAQSQPRPGLAAPQRIVAPQLIVRPPQQQTTIQLPPGFTIPPGKVAGGEGEQQEAAVYTCVNNDLKVRLMGSVVSRIQHLTVISVMR